MHETLTLKALITTAADDILNYFIIIIFRGNMAEISCKLSAIKFYSLKKITVLLTSFRKSYFALCITQEQ